MYPNVCPASFFLPKVFQRFFPKFKKVLLSHPVLLGESFHLVVEQEVDGECVAGAVGEDGAQHLTVLVAHPLGHVEQHCVVDLLDVDPTQGDALGRWEKALVTNTGLPGLPFCPVVWASPP